MTLSSLLFSIQPIFAEVRFVGLAFYLSLLFLWVLVQGFIWLSVRYSRLISTAKWWKSAMVAFATTVLMVFGWDLPRMISGTESLMVSMSSAIGCGAIATWILSGYLYNFEFMHRTIVAIGVPLLYFCASATGLVLYSKLI